MMKDIHAPIIQLSGESLFNLAKCNEKQDIVFSFLNNSDFKKQYDIERFIKNNLIILLSNSIYPVGTKKAHIMSCGDKTKINNFAEMVNINLTGNSNDIINFGSNCEISTSGNYDIIGSYGFNNGNIYSITGEKVFCSLNAVDECIFNNKNDYRNFPKNTLHFKGKKSNKIFTMFCKLDFGKNDLLKWNYINNENKFVEDDNVCFFRK